MNSEDTDNTGNTDSTDGADNNSADNNGSTNNSSDTSATFPDVCKADCLWFPLPLPQCSGHCKLLLGHNGKHQCDYDSAHTWSS
jgi:hypothetical protein